MTITVEGKPECTTTKESWGGFFNGPFGEGCDVVASDTVKFTDSVTTRIHIVQNLAITSVDKQANTVSGTADDGAVVYGWVHEYGYDMQLQVEGSIWLADFGSAGLDLVENMGGRAEIRDELGNATAVDWWIPNPRFTVFPEWNWYDGMDWPDDVPVTIMVNDNPNCSAVRYSENGFFNGGFPEGCDVIVGDLISMTDGITMRTHTVRTLAVTGVDAEANTVSGIAEEGAVVNVWLYTAEGSRQAIAVEGNWQVDLSDLSDLTSGECGRSETGDTFGNVTSVELCAP